MGLGQKFLKKFLYQLELINKFMISSPEKNLDPGMVFVLIVVLNAYGNERFFAGKTFPGGIKSFLPGSMNASFTNGSARLA